MGKEILRDVSNGGPALFTVFTVGVGVFQATRGGGGRKGEAAEAALAPRRKRESGLVHVSVGDD